VKKVLCGLLVMGLLAGGAQLRAQGRKTEVSLNVGVQTNVYSGSSFDGAMFSLDARVGIPIGRFQIGPEIMAVVDDSFRGGYLLYPGAMLNFLAGRFFVGAGAVVPIAHAYGETETGRIAPRVNIGYNLGHFKLTAFFIMYNERYIDFLDVNFLGATVGYRF